MENQKIVVALMTKAGPCGGVLDCGSGRGHARSKVQRKTIPPSPSTHPDVSS